MESDRLFWDARARIIWGEPSSSVRHFLISNGVSETIADSKIKEFIFEKCADLKKDAIKEILEGAILLSAVGGVLLYITHAGGLISAIFFARVAIMLGFIGVYGLWKLVKGFISFVGAQFKYQCSNNKQSDEFYHNNIEEKVAENSPFHKVLGVSSLSSLKEIKTAYRNRIKMYHPDKFGNQSSETQQWAEEMSKTVNLAYETLVKETKERQ